MVTRRSLRLAPVLLGFLTLLGGFPGRAERAPAPPKPPVAQRIPRVEVLHGERRVDDYYWLRDKQNPAVRAYLEAENAYTDALLAPHARLKESLYQEILSHIKETDLEVPYRQGGWYYYARTEKGKQYPIRCRKQRLDGPEQVVLDLNELAIGHPFLAVGAYQVSDDDHRVAFSTDVTGYREYTLMVKDLRSGKLLAEHIPRTTSVAWAADNATLFYVTEDHAKRPYRLWRHRLDEAKDELLYEEKDERFRVRVGRSRSKAWLILSIASHATAEARVLPATRPRDPWRLVAPRIQDQEYYLDHRGDRFYIRVNDRGRNYRLVEAPVADPGRARWREIVPHRDDVMIEDLDVFADHYVLWERRDGLPRLRVVDFASGRSRDVAFTEPTYSIDADNNREFRATAFRYSYESLITPKSVYDYDLATGQSRLLKQAEVPGGFDRTRYGSARLFASAPDGTKIPVSLVYKKGCAQDGRGALYLEGYGAYGEPYWIEFRPDALPLLDRGVAMAYAHVRGGGEYGKRWHDDGRMMKKRNSFTDLVAVAEHLVRERWVARDRLALTGISAGGLLASATVNLRPEFFRAVVVNVPFVDVVNTMLDETIPFTVPEFEEWGNPKVKAHYDYLKGYAPYENLQRRRYPAMLVRTALNDSQVPYWEPAKYVARLRTLATGPGPLLLRTDMGAGHGGASGRYDKYRELAHDHAFVLWQLGVAR
jgi:oligopeptidase B